MFHIFLYYYCYYLFCCCWLLFTIALIVCDIFKSKETSVMYSLALSIFLQDTKLIINISYNFMYHILFKSYYYILKSLFLKYDSTFGINKFHESYQTYQIRKCYFRLKAKHRTNMLFIHWPQKIISVAAARK